MADEGVRKKSFDISESARVAALQSRIDRLETMVDHLKQVNRALWEMVSGRLELSEEDLKQRVRAKRAEVEASRGTIRPATPCAKCGRPLDRGSMTCHYCGAVNTEGDLFDGVI
jgi:DNA repair exonuclease SbcCD ATPase subunit